MLRMGASLNVQPKRLSWPCRLSERLGFLSGGQQYQPLRDLPRRPVLQGSSFGMPILDLALAPELQARFPQQHWPRNHRRYRFQKSPFPMLPFAPPLGNLTVSTRISFVSDSFTNGSGCSQVAKSSPHANVSSGTKAAVAGRLMAQPVYPPEIAHVLRHLR